MKKSVEYHLNKATVPVIVDHLLHCDDDFIPPLSNRVKINDYAIKISSKATRFEAWSGGRLVGFVAAYCNNSDTRMAFITTVSVLKARMGEGIASRMLRQCVDYTNASGMEQIKLVVDCNNRAAIRLYKKIGFVMDELNVQFVTMKLHLNCGEAHD